MGHEVTSLQPTGTLLGSALVIHHTNPGTATPIRLQDRSNAIESAISAMDRTPTGAPITRNPTRTATSLLAMLSALIGLGFAAFGIVLTIRHANPIDLAFTAMGTLIAVLAVRDLLMIRKSTH